MQNTNKDLQDSGYYKAPFYTERHLPFISVRGIKWNRELHLQYVLGVDYIVKDSDKMHKLSHDDFCKNFSSDYYYEVDERHYNEEDAYKCHLIPFNICSNGKNQFLLISYYAGNSIYFDAYFFLQTGKLDPNSMYFRDKEHFKRVLSPEIFNAIEDKFEGVKT